MALFLWAAAHGLLPPDYNWFTEGFDTADLKGVKALLAELSQITLKSHLNAPVGNVWGIKEYCQVIESTFPALPPDTRFVACCRLCIPPQTGNGLVGEIFLPLRG